jgi:ATP-dependent RNA helicase RhlE
LYTELESQYGSETAVIHGNKSQNYRFRSVDQFERGDKRIMIATDVMARGLDIDDITQVINFDIPTFPENYMHRIGRTGRAEKVGEALAFYTPKEEMYVDAISALMNYQIPIELLPHEVEISQELIPEERPDDFDKNDPNRNTKKKKLGAGFHEKKDKNKKENQGGSYKKKIKAKYKKPKTKGDKIANRKNKKK